LAAVVFVLANLMADLIYPLLDPRVKLFGDPGARLASAEESAVDGSGVVTP
jgi:peptide/nickel transport system permease protein